MGAKIVVYLLKAAISPGLWLGRVLIFNRHAPPVGRVVKDLKYGPRRRQAIDLYVPQGEPPWPVLVFIHGGGWISGDKAMYARVARTFAARGHLTFCASYRLAPQAGFPAAMQDAAAAVRWVYEHAGEHGGLRSRMFLAGDSAGAHLACWYAVALGDPQLLDDTGIRDVVPREAIRGLALFYGVYDVEDAARARFPFARTLGRCLLGTGEEAARRAWVASPLRHVRGDLPPMFLCAGERDGLYGQTVRMAAALRDRGVPHETLLFSRARYPAALHGFLNLYFLNCASEAMEAAGDFLDRLSRADGCDMQ